MTSLTERRKVQGKSRRFDLSKLHNDLLHDRKADALMILGCCRSGYDMSIPYGPSESSGARIMETLSSVDGKSLASSGPWVRRLADKLDHMSLSSARRVSVEDLAKAIEVKNHPDAPGHYRKVCGRGSIELGLMPRIQGFYPIVPSHSKQQQHGTVWDVPSFSRGIITKAGVPTGLTLKRNGVPDDVLELAMKQVEEMKRKKHETA